MRILIMSVLCLGLLGCKSEPGYEKIRTKKIGMTHATLDLQVPAPLWKEIESVYLPMIFDRSGVAEDGSVTKSEIPTEFTELKVYLIEKSPGTLGRENYELDFGKGGGLLDLKEFVQSDRGSFYFAAVPVVTKEDEELRVFFLSNSKQRNVHGESLGVGCDTYLDISKYFNKAMKKDGILVSTLENRHVSLLGGSFFFVISVKGKLYVSQLTVRDSRFKSLHCRWR